MDTINFLLRLKFNTELFKSLTTALGLFTNQQLNGIENVTSFVNSISSVLNSSSSSFINSFVANSSYSEQQVVSGLLYLRDCAIYTASESNSTLLIVANLESCFANQPSSQDLVDCSENNNEAAVTWIGVSLSLLFIILLSLFNKRSQFFPDVLNGKPGPVVPLNMLDHFENRFGYAAAFGATTGHAVTALFGSYTPLFGVKASAYLKSNAFPGWASVFIQMLASVVVALAYYPFFVCLNRSRKLLFCLIGVLFSSIWSLQLIAVRAITFSCLIKQKAISYAAIFDIIINIPSYLCVVILLLVNLWNTWLWFKKKWITAGKCKKNYILKQSTWKETHLFKHVWTIVNVEWKRRDIEDKILDKKLSSTRIGGLRQKLYTIKPEFKYSLRVICSFSVAALALYMLISILVFVAYAIFDNGILVFLNSKQFDDAMIQLGLESSISDVIMYFDVIRISLYLSIAFSTIIIGITFANMTALYRKHILRLRKGNKAWLPKCVTNMTVSRASLASSSMKFAGFQIGYIVWGYAVLAVLLWLVMSIIGAQLIMPLIHLKTSFLLNLVINLWPAVLISVVLNVAQLLAAKFIFLHGKGSTFFINNRSAFHITSYFMFFFNIILGFASCLLRIVKGVIIGVLFLARLQKSLLPRGYEDQDPGYLAYIGYVVLEHAHTSPVLFVFTRLLEDDYRQRKHSHHVIESKPDENLKNEFELGHHNAAWVRARNRWQLYKMLSENPSLIRLRNHQIKKFENEIQNNIQNEIVILNHDKIMEKDIEVLI